MSKPQRWGKEFRSAALKNAERQELQDFDPRCSKV